MAENYIIRENIKFKNLTKNHLAAINTANMVISMDIFQDKVEAALLKALLMQIHFKVQKKLIENKKSTSLTLTTAEAIAFFKLHNQHTTCDAYTFSILNPILSEIQSKLI